jgi:hypothetical protein
MALVAIRGNLVAWSDFYKTATLAVAAQASAQNRAVVSVLSRARHHHGNEYGGPRRTASGDWTAFCTGKLHRLCEPAIA